MIYDLGDVVPLTLEVRDPDTQELEDAGDATLTITLPDGTTVEPSPTHPGTGTYANDYAAPTAGTYLVRWVTTGANAGAYTDTFTVRAAADIPLISLALAKDRLGITDTSNDAEIRTFLDVATALVERKTGRLYRRTGVVDALIPNGPVLRLTKNPVLSITSVVEAGETLTATDYLLDPRGLLYRVSGTAARHWDGSLAQRVQASYTVGSTAVPAIIEQAVVETLRHLWQTQRGAGDTRRPFGGDDYAPGSTFSMPRRVEELLADISDPGGFA